MLIHLYISFSRKLLFFHCILFSISLISLLQSTLTSMRRNQFSNQTTVMSTSYFTIHLSRLKRICDKEVSHNVIHFHWAICGETHSYRKHEIVLVVFIGGSVFFNHMIMRYICCNATKQQKSEKWWKTFHEKNEQLEETFVRQRNAFIIQPNEYISHMFHKYMFLYWQTIG